MSSVPRKKNTVLHTKKPCGILFYIHNDLQVLVPFTVQM